MKKLLLLFLFAAGVWGQAPRAGGVEVVFSAPSGACLAHSPLRFMASSNTLYGCGLTTPVAVSGTWALIGGSGASVSSVGLSSNLGTVGGSPVTGSGTMTLTGAAADLIALFSGCSGTMYLGADGACHTVSSGLAFPVTVTGGVSGGIPYFSSTTNMAASSAGVTGAMMAWGGAGNAPTSPRSLLVTNQNATNETWTLRNTIASGVTNLTIRGGASNSTSNSLITLMSNSGSTILRIFENGVYNFDGGTSSPDIRLTGAARLYDNTNGGLLLASNKLVSYANGTSVNGSPTFDVALGRDAAGIININNGTNGTTAANYRALKSSAQLIAGTTFTASGCSNGTLVGGATAGSYTSGTAGTCTVTVTMGNSATATNGWVCSVWDVTTPADIQSMTASNATTATFSGVTVSGDVIKFACVGY